MGDPRQQVDEAIQAGQRVLAQLDVVEDQLSRAGIWGWIDIFSKGFISAIFKHSRLNEADHAMAQLTALIDEFNREISDVKVWYNVQKIGMGNGWAIADGLLDNIILDAIVLTHIGEVQKQIAEIRPQVNAALENLYTLRVQMG